MSASSPVFSKSPTGDQAAATPDGRRRRYVVAVALVAILMVAAIFRFVWLDRIPTGWHHDEALMGVMSGEVYRGEQRPLFFRQYLGQEPLYIYLAAATIALMGGDESFMPQRITSAVVSLATVGLTFLVGRAMFGTRVGLIGAALIAISFWQVMSGRMAYRSITQPLVESIAVLLFWWARGRGGRVAYALAGAATGAVLYTYLGARAFPGIFIVFALWLLVTGRRPTRRDLVHAATFAIAAALVALPLVIFFLINPGTFSARMNQVFIFRPGVSQGQPWRLLLESTNKMISSFTISGEPMWRYNIPGRPMFVGLLGLAFYVGIGRLLRDLLRRNDAAAFALIWIAVMFFPSILSWETGAYTLRAMGLVPVVYLVPALGLDWAMRFLERRGTLARSAAAAGLALVLIVETTLTARDYFVVWAPSFGAAWEDSADAVAQARFLSAHARPEDEQVWVASEYYHHPVLAQLARDVYPTLRWFDGRQSVAFSPDASKPALYVLAYNGMPPVDENLFANGQLVGSERFPAGVDGDAPPPLFLAYRLTPDQVRETVTRLAGAAEMRSVPGRIPNVVEPIAASLDGPAGTGQALAATLLWRIVQPPPPGEYQMLAHLVDGRGIKVAGVDALGYPVEEWRPGDVVWTRFAIPVDVTVAPGLYNVQVAIYHRATLERLRVEGGSGGANALDLGSVRVIATAPPDQPARAVGARLGDAIELVGVDAPEIENQAIDVSLYWRADHVPRENFTVFVQLLSPEGRLVAQSDSWPARGALPTSAWLTGEIVLDRHMLVLPENLPRGRYRLIGGMYQLATGARLPASTGGDFVDLGTIDLGG